MGGTIPDIRDRALHTSVVKKYVCVPFPLFSLLAEFFA